jgi:hypothetical protein
VTNQVADRLALEHPPGGMVVAADSLWVATIGAPTLVRVDPTAGVTSGSWTVAGDASGQVQAITQASGAFWIPLGAERQVVRVAIPS